MAEAALGWALELLLEDEQRLMAADREEEIAFGRWLTLAESESRSFYAILSKSLPQLIKGLIATRLVDGFQAYGQFTTVSSMAEAAGMSRTQLFACWAPRVQLLPPLVEGYLTVMTGQPRLAALTYFSHLDLASDDSTAYGVQKTRRPTRSVLRLSGIAGLGGDFILPQTSQPDMTGMAGDPGQPQVDPAYRERVEEELARTGQSLSRSHADHHEHHLGINSGARAILTRAVAAGSRACRRARVKPEEVLDRAFPPWFAVGPVGHGISTGPLLASEGHIMPGGRADLIQVALEHNMRPLYRLFDSIEHGPASLSDIVFSAEGAYYSGPQFAGVLMSPDRFARLPGLSEVAPPVLEGLGASQELAELGVSIDSAQVGYLWQRRGLVLADGRGGQLRLSLVLRSEKGRNTAWVTVANLNDPATLADVIARCDLHFLSDGDVTHAPCVPRTFREFGLHSLQPHRHDTRSWMQLACLVTNHFLVEVARARQADSAG